MAQLTDPFIGSNWGWDEGEDGWGVGLNETLIQHSFLHNRRIDGIVSVLPASPSDGQAYFLTSDNRVYFRADGSWYGSNVPRGMDFILKSNETRYEFNGSTLVPVTDTINSEDINYSNSSSGLSSTNVQDAIDEVVEELSGKVDTVAGKQLSTEDYTTTEKNKLSGVAIGATANQTDTYLLNRSNHTGSQPISTITNLESTLNSKQDVSNLVQNLESPNSSTYLSTQGLAEAFADVMAGESYQGEWDADTNTPTLTSGAGTQGFYYQVSVAGDTNLDGISDWSLGDEVLFDGTVWKKRKNYQSVVSVNGQTGPVVLSASDVGAVSSVGVSVPTGLQVSNTPVTSSGTISISLQSGYSIPTTANQTNWTTAYSERNRWDGGATGLVAATGRTSLGLGTAATTNITITYTDTTIGSIPVIRAEGIFGLGNVGGAQNLPSTGAGSADLQTIPTGLYIALASSFASPPFGATDVYLDVHRGGGSQAQQTAYAFGTVPRKAIRNYVSGSWSGWREEWNSGNLVKTTSATDTTAGRVPTVGWMGIGAAGNMLLTNPDDVPVNGLWRGGGTSALGAYPSFLHMGDSATHNTQIGGPALIADQLLFRKKLAGVWQTPYSFWHSGNLVKTTSPTDVTPGSMLKVGDFGISAPVLLDAPNLSSVLASGSYYANSPTNGPGGNGWLARSALNSTFFTQEYVQVGNGDRHHQSNINGVLTPWRKYWDTGNTSADVQWMLGSADNTAIRSNISASKQVVVRTVSTSTHNFDIADESAYHRFVFNGAKTATIRPTATHSLGTWWSAVIRVVGTGNLTLTPGDVSVTINPPYGGSLVMEPGMTATLIKVGTDVYDLIGQTVPA